MKVIEKHLDLHISCPFTGKILWVREINPNMYPFLEKAGYNWLFQKEQIVEEPIKKTIKK